MLNLRVRVCGQLAWLVMLMSPPVMAEGGWLPSEPLFAHLVAGLSEPDTYAAVASFDTKQSGSITLALASLGHQFPLYRWETLRWGRWQLGFFATIKSQFNLDVSNQALINADYLAGFPLSWQSGDWSVRARLFHQSSHLGDELILDGEAPERQNLSYEAIDTVAAREWSHWRVYAGLLYVLRKQWEALGNVGGQLGAEYVSGTSVLGGRWVTALAGRWTEAFKDDPQTTLSTGLRFGGHTPEQTSVYVAATAFHGAAPFGQFFEVTSSYYGLVIKLQSN